MDYSWVGIITFAVILFLTMIVFNIISDHLDGWKEFVLGLIVSILVGLLFVFQAAVFITKGEKDASKECLNGDCPYEQKIHYEKTDTGKVAVDTTYHLK